MADILQGRVLSVQRVSGDLGEAKLVQGPRGEQGIGIEDLQLDEQGNLKTTLTDGREIDSGNVAAPAEAWAEAAARSARNAQFYESHAAASSIQANSSANWAEAKAAEAAGSAILAESWAVGGTGTREGEDENNARYWAEYGNDYFLPIQNPHAAGGLEIGENNSIEQGADLYVVIGEENTVSGVGAVAIGIGNSATDRDAVVMGEYCQATGQGAHAEGRKTIAASLFAHAEGVFSHAEGYGSHAEGESSHATSTYSHAEGHGTYANGDSSHAEGAVSRANARGSHAEGECTVADCEYQHVSGRFNIADDSVYAEIVGNGSNSGRSNARTLDWQGNGWYAGKVSVGAVETPPEIVADNELTTKAYVDGVIQAAVGAALKRSY